MLSEKDRHTKRSDLEGDGDDDDDNGTITDIIEPTASSMLGPGK